MDNNSTGRRPKRSDNMPTIGPKKNCISPQVIAKTIVYWAASAVSPPANCFTRFGSTGIMMPRLMTSISAVAKMNSTAAFLGPFGTAGADCGLRGCVIHRSGDFTRLRPPALLAF